MSHFNQVANEWDSEFKSQMMEELAIKTLKKLKLEGKLDILDFGCGTGLFGLEFLDHIQTLTGIDTSPGMLEVFEQKTKGHENIKSLNINLENEHYAGKFDLIISSMTFHHLETPLDVLVKLKHCLKPNGKIAIVDLDREDGTFHPDNEGMGVKHFGFSKEELSQWSCVAELNLDHSFINSITKNEREYKQFLAVFSLVAT
jgi:SAM-dependent methyltransferase